VSESWKLFISITIVLFDNTMFLLYYEPVS